MKAILEAVAGQKLGYSYGKPIRVDEKMLSVVLPILRITSNKRQYTTFPETGEKVQVFDTGKIDEMEVQNGTEDNVFIRSGTLFRGSTQERALMRSAILFPGKKQKLGVRCVHATRGISPNAPVKYGGITPLSFDSANYAKGYVHKDQSTTWANVHKTTSAMNMHMGKTASDPSTERLYRSTSIRNSGENIGGINYMSSVGGPGHLIGADIPVEDMAAEFAAGSAFSAGAKSDDLFSTFSDFSMHFDEILSKVKLVENQAGLALINHNGVETIEFFDHKDSWKALHESAVKRLGSNIVSKDDESVFEYKPENAVKQVNRILAMDFKLNRIFEHRPSNGEPHVEITGLSAEKYVGEAVEVNGTLIHLVLLRQTE